MSRENISILIATGLLGVLLWVVISIARDWGRLPAAPLPLPAEIVEIDPALPRLLTRTDLRNWLTEKGYLADVLIGGYRDWLAERGYPGFSVLLDGPGTDTIGADYADMDDADLVLLAGRGDSSAALLLGEKSLETDPLAALDWFDQASVNGSVFGMIRMADLLATLSSLESAEFVSTSSWQEALEQRNAGAPPLGEQALAWALAAVIVGGYAVLDPSHADRIESLTMMLDDAANERACALAQDYVLTTATARRAQGGMVFSMQAPPLALSVANPAATLPCDVPLIPLVSLDACSQQDFVGPGTRLMTAWLCTGD